MHRSSLNSRTDSKRSFSSKQRRTFFSTQSPSSESSATINGIIQITILNIDWCLNCTCYIHQLCLLNKLIVGKNCNSNSMTKVTCRMNMITINIFVYWCKTVLYIQMYVAPNKVYLNDISILYLFSRKWSFGI